MSKTNYGLFLVGPLFDYVREQNLAARDKQLSLREEVAIARHCLGEYLRVYQAASRHVERMRTIGESEFNPTRIQEAQETALKSADLLLEGVKKVSDIVKRAADAEAALANRYVGLEIVGVIDQVQNILYDELKNLDREDVLRLLGDGNSDGNENGQQRKFLKSVVEKEIIEDGKNEIEVEDNAFFERVINKVRERIENDVQAVRLARSEKEVPSGGVSFKLGQQVDAMIESVPGSSSGSLDEEW